MINSHENINNNKVNLSDRAKNAIATVDKNFPDKSNNQTPVVSQNNNSGPDVNEDANNITGGIRKKTLSNANINNIRTSNSNVTLSSKAQSAISAVDKKFKSTNVQSSLSPKSPLNFTPKTLKLEAITEEEAIDYVFGDLFDK